jgi:hypothetical protein
VVAPASASPGIRPHGAARAGNRWTRAGRRGGGPAGARAGRAKGPGLRRLLPDARLLRCPAWRRAHSRQAALTPSVRARASCPAGTYGVWPESGRAGSPQPAALLGHRPRPPPWRRCCLLARAPRCPRPSQTCSCVAGRPRPRLPPPAGGSAASTRRASRVAADKARGWPSSGRGGGSRPRPSGPRVPMVKARPRPPACRRERVRRAERPRGGGRTCLPGLAGVKVEREDAGAARCLGLPTGFRWLLCFCSVF